MLTRLKALLGGRCPHCLQGPIFARFLTMHTHCTVCGIKYEREPGYFLMGIFFGYILSFIAVAAGILFVWLFLPRSVWSFVIGGAVPLLLLAPLIFKYGRIIWLHVDELIDPRKTAADMAGSLPPPHGIDLMLAHENETKDHWYERKILTDDKGDAPLK